MKWFPLWCAGVIAAALVTGASQPAHAHEVRPAIADVTLQPGDAATGKAPQIVLDVAANIEAFVARVDLADITDTNDDANSDRYDALRRDQPEVLEAAFRQYWPYLRDRLNVETNGARVPLTLESVRVPIVGNPLLPRTSQFVITGQTAGPVTIGWAPEFGRLVVRQLGVADGDAYTGMINGGEKTPVISAAGGESEGGLATFVRYVVAGFDHIIPKGLDHILFVLGLFFLAPRLVPLLWQVSAFTLAHTITLALGALGLVSISPSIVEPLIALSIVYVAVENLFMRDLGVWRPALIFGFGLLHGLGFASVLEEFGLPDDQFIPALIGFNVGVEAGQLTVIALAFLAVGLWFRSKSWYRVGIAIPASLAIAAIGAFWVVERTGILAI